MSQLRGCVFTATEVIAVAHIVCLNYPRKKQILGFCLLLIGITQNQNI